MRVGMDSQSELLKEAEVSYLIFLNDPGNAISGLVIFPEYFELTDNPSAWGRLQSVARPRVYRRMFR